MSAAVDDNSGGKLGPTTNEGRTETISILFSSQNFQAAFSARVLDKAYQIFQENQFHHKMYVIRKSMTEPWMTSINTCSFSHSSSELQNDSSRGTLGTRSLTLTVDEDEVRTMRFRSGFFLHERRTFIVPSMAGFKISDYKSSHFR